MKIDIRKHLEYIKTTFSNEEMEKIIAFLDKQEKGLREKWLAGKYKNTINEDMFMWYFLVSQFIAIPDGKKTKAFFYQVLVLNGITNDELNGKKICFQKNKNSCNLIKNIENSSWTDEMRFNCCLNLSICLIFPATIIPIYYFDKYPDGMFIEIDDSIMQKIKI